MTKIRPIAFYLPQFYPTPENDQWWGKGFTEWTNTGRAKPLFHGHEQPKVPADLGYYDLRLPEIREQQAALAKEANIEGFCYWHYWFNGTRLLDRVFSEVLQSGKPDYPFCLCWANHSWYAKTWDPAIPDKLLIEQTYPGENDYINHFRTMLPAFKDKRYMKMENEKLIFVIFAPFDIPDTKLFFTTWNKLAQKHGLAGFHFIAFANSNNVSKLNELRNLGYDAIICDYLVKAMKITLSKRILNKCFHIPYCINYASYVNYFVNTYKDAPDLYPCLYPNFDHTPRSAYRGIVLHKSTPKLWGQLCCKVFNKLTGKRAKNNLVFIKAWNEWGEGNYLEPDLKYGKQYLQELLKALKSRVS